MAVAAVASLVLVIRPPISMHGINCPESFFRPRLTVTMLDRSLAFVTRLCLHNNSVAPLVRFGW